MSIQALPCIVVLQTGGTLKVEVVIGTPQRGPYHLSLRQANPGTLFTGDLHALHYVDAIKRQDTA